MRPSQSVVYWFLQAPSASKFSALKATLRCYTWKMCAAWWAPHFLSPDDNLKTILWIINLCVATKNNLDPKFSIYTWNNGHLIISTPWYNELTLSRREMKNNAWLKSDSEYLHVQDRYSLRRLAISWTADQNLNHTNVHEH